MYRPDNDNQPCWLFCFRKTPPSTGLRTTLCRIQMTPASWGQGHPRFKINPDADRIILQQPGCLVFQDPLFSVIVFGGRRIVHQGRHHVPDVHRVVRTCVPALQKIRMYQNITGWVQLMLNRWEFKVIRDSRTCQLKAEKRPGKCGFCHFITATSYLRASAKICVKCKFDKFATQNLQHKSQKAQR